MIAARRLGHFFPLIVAALLPAIGRAHSTDFILVKVSPHAGRVDVELTADYGGNPMFKDKAEAQAVLTSVLRVRSGEGHAASELSALAPLRFEDRHQFDPTAPIPLDPTSAAEPHQLLTAVWSWHGAGQKVSFEMPDDSNQSAILWTSGNSQSGPGGSSGGVAKEARWVFLLPGEISPEIMVPPRSLVGWLISCAGAGVVGVSATIGFGLASKRRRKSRVRLG